MDKLREHTWLPENLNLGQPYFFLHGNRELYLQNISRATHYCDNLIKLQSKTMNISGSGCKLCIDYYRGDEMKIVGKIEKLELSL